jgi:hypothetical protein
MPVESRMIASKTDVDRYAGSLSKTEQALIERIVCRTGNQRDV